MKSKLKECTTCKEETVNDVGKKQATSKSGSYIRRRTSRCRQCGKREIENIKRREKKSISGKNQLALEEKTE